MSAAAAVAFRFVSFVVAIDLQFRFKRGIFRLQVWSVSVNLSTAGSLFRKKAVLAHGASPFESSNQFQVCGTLLFRVNSSVKDAV